MGVWGCKRQEQIVRVLIHVLTLLLAILLSSSSIHYVGSGETDYWRNLAAIAWRYYQPGKGVEASTGLHHAGLYWPYFTDWDLSNYIMAVLDAEELGLIPQGGGWGSDYRLSKLINFLKTRPLTTEGVPYLWYDSRTGTNHGNDRANPSDSGKLLLVLDRLRKVKPQYSADVDYIVNVRTNYRALAADERAWSSTSGPYAYLAALGFARFGMGDYAPVRRALETLEALENAPKVSVEGVELPQAYLTLEPFLHLVFEADYDRRVSSLLFKLYLVHELRFQRGGPRLAFSEGNTGLDNPSYVYEWVVTGDGGIWVITDHSGTRRNDVTPISFFKVAVGFRAIYDSEYSRNLTDWIYSLFSKYNEPNCGSFDCGFMEGADTSGRVVGVIIDRTNSLVLSAARYTIKGLLESYAVVRDISGGVWYRELNGGRGPWISLGGITPRTPSAAFYNGKLYVTINDVTDGIWVGSIDPSSRVFSGWRPLPGLTPSKPTLVSSDHGLILVVRDVSNGIWIYKNSTGEWIPLPGLTIDSPAASAVRDILHIVVRGG